MKLRILERTPSVQEFNYLRKMAEWPVMDDALVNTALENTLFSVVAETQTGELAGMARIIGDGAIYFHISDVIVHPEYQNTGVGTLMMKHLMRVLESRGGKGTNIGLMCSKGREPFYKKFGFIERPSDKFGAGMTIVKSS